MLAAAAGATGADDRYDAAAAVLTLGRPLSVGTRVFLERARSAHTPFDEVLQALAQDDLAAGAGDRGRVQTGLRLLMAARRFEEALRVALSVGGNDADTNAVLCAAGARLGLKVDVIAPYLACAPGMDVRAATVRESFEGAPAWSGRIS